MDFENFIESQYRELIHLENIEFLYLYNRVYNKSLRKIFSTLHSNMVSLFKLMNNRLPTNEYGAHFWADSSRDLIKILEVTQSLQRGLKSSKYSFDIDSYYFSKIEKCLEFLSSSGGSQIPPYMEKIDLYYTIPIFKMSETIEISGSVTTSYNLKLIGQGSYANVYSYIDKSYNKKIALKRAIKSLNDTEIRRFREEFNYLNECKSPYILEVYKYNESKNEYTMEYMDYTLDEYIEKNNTKLSITKRRGICLQILKAFDYIHSKQLLHRDISPKNVLVKIYEDIVVAKVSDFGLIKNPKLNITSFNTEIKGYYNDPELILEGFNNYSILHETYALTRLLCFVMTGKTNIDSIKNKSLKTFVGNGLSSDKTKRYKNCEDLKYYYLQIEF
ncbi:protein kinase family protein [Miniphocaeibacter massiliensis]|uniref:protein kinase family protein n=1 Tax=Miniphocaeibacter massiliensis TaxID=2041841 RepID=UPI000C1C3F89|nr:protein kinase family protein [Miniphocaeibacter massiliensis]